MAIKLPKKTVKNDPSVIMSSFRVHDSRSSSSWMDARTDDIEDFVRQGGFDRCPMGFNFNLLVMGGTNHGKRPWENTMAGWWFGGHHC